MLLFTAKLSKRKLITGVLIAAILVCVIIIAAKQRDGAFLDAFSDSVKTTDIRTNDDRVAFLGALGYTVDPVIAEVQEAPIPKKFSETFEAYNALQLLQGCDLTDYKGRKVTRYTYRITDHPAGEEVYADLLVYKDTVIGGDVCSKGVDGFMEPLCRNTP